MLRSVYQRSHRRILSDHSGHQHAQRQHHKLFAANIKLTDKIVPLTLSTTLGLDVNLGGYQAATMQLKKCGCPTNGGLCKWRYAAPNDAVHTWPAQGQIFSGGGHASARMLLLFWE
ncbi:MAG: hypothetical protein ABSE80_05540 [Halobacteriota archaeon]